MGSSAGEQLVCEEIMKHIYSQHTLKRLFRGREVCCDRNGSVLNSGLPVT